MVNAIFFAFFIKFWGLLGRISLFTFIQFIWELQAIISQNMGAMNGFDESFFAHQEEIDLCWRLINSGKKIFYTGKSAVYHIGGGTLNKTNPQKTYLNIRNNLSMLVKNLPLSSLFWVIPFRLCLDFFMAMYLGYKEGWAHIFAVARAHFAFYTRFLSLINKRMPFQKREYYQMQFLVFRYYIMRKN